MRELIGVMPVADVVYSRTLKREALMFNRIAMHGISLILNSRDSGDYLQDTINDVEWLFERGIIFNPLAGGALWDKSLAKQRSQDFGVLEPNWSQGLGIGRVILGNIEFGPHGIFREHFECRVIASVLREANEMNSHPVFTIPMPFPVSSQVVTTEVIKIVLRTLPIPDCSTSWEHIMEYRDDPASQAKFLDLKNWISEIARTGLSPIEMEEKLEHLLSSYERHMALHKMKTNRGVLETFVVTTAEILEGLVHLKFGEVAKALFSFKHRNIALMEGELKSPGSEVAYIVKARETFS